MGAQKSKWKFTVKSELHLKKVCYKVSLCEYYQRQSCKAFTGLSIRAKMVRERCPLLGENFAETDPLPSKTVVNWPAGKPGDFPVGPCFKKFFAPSPAVHANLFHWYGNQLTQ